VGPSRQHNFGTICPLNCWGEVRCPCLCHGAQAYAGAPEFVGKWASREGGSHHTRLVITDSATSEVLGKAPIAVGFVALSREGTVESELYMMNLFNGSSAMAEIIKTFNPVMQRIDLEYAPSWEPIFTPAQRLEKAARWVATALRGSDKGRDLQLEKDLIQVLAHRVKFEGLYLK